VRRRFYGRATIEPRRGATRWNRPGRGRPGHRGQCRCGDLAQRPIAANDTFQEQGPRKRRQADCLHRAAKVVRHTLVLSPERHDAMEPTLGPAERKAPREGPCPNRREFNRCAAIVNKIIFGSRAPIRHVQKVTCHAGAGRHGLRAGENLTVWPPAGKMFADIRRESFLSVWSSRPLHSVPSPPHP